MSETPSGIPGAQNYRNAGALPERLPGMARIMDAVGSSVPEAARAAAMRANRWTNASGRGPEFAILCDDDQATVGRFMALADAEVAAAVAEERATTGRALEALAHRPIVERDERTGGYGEGYHDAISLVRAALASPGEGE